MFIKHFLLSVCLLFSFAAPAYATSYNGYNIPTSYPISAVSRAKFPKVNGVLIDELTYINKYVNSTITYELDSKHYGQDDVWIMDPEDHKGDCEDYALTKLSLLEQVGNKNPDNVINQVGIVEDTKIVNVVVAFDDYDELGVQSAGHAILAIRLPDRSVAYLDLNNDELMTKKELQKWRTYGRESARYEFQNW